MQGQRVPLWPNVDTRHLEIEKEATGARQKIHNSLYTPYVTNNVPLLESVWKRNTKTYVDTPVALGGNRKERSGSRGAFPWHRPKLPVESSSKDREGPRMSVNAASPPEPLSERRHVDLSLRDYPGLLLRLDRESNRRRRSYTAIQVSPATVWRVSCDLCHVDKANSRMCR